MSCIIGGCVLPEKILTRGIDYTTPYVHIICYDIEYI